MKKEEIGTKFDKVKLTAKEKIAEAWNWTKDHWVPIALGAVALGGGAYLLSKKDEGSGAEAPRVYPEPDNDEIRERIQDAWDACDPPEPDPYGGPTED